MKKIIIVFSIACGLLAIAPQVKSQDFLGKLFFAEFGGPGVITSFNFDSRFKTGERLGLGYRLGVGFGIYTFDTDPTGEWPYGNEKTRTFYSIPFGLNYVLGKNYSAHSFEIGAGATFLTRKVSLYYYDVKKPGHFTGYLSFMYRRVPLDGGFTFRVGFTPIIGTSGDLYPMVAIGLGYAF